MGSLRVLVFFMFKKVGGTNPRTALSGQLYIGLWILTDQRAPKAFALSRLSSCEHKRETHTPLSLRFLWKNHPPWPHIGFRPRDMWKHVTCLCHVRLATWGSCACTVQLAGPFKLNDFKCPSSAPVFTLTLWHSLRSPVAVAFAELSWWPCACAAFGCFVL